MGLNFVCQLAASGINVFSSASAHIDDNAGGFDTSTEIGYFVDTASFEVG
jgi:hypothetical protein